MDTPKAPAPPCPPPRRIARAAGYAPGERVHIASIGRFWRLLGAVLEDLAA